MEIKLKNCIVSFKKTIVPETTDVDIDTLEVQNNFVTSANAWIVGSESQNMKVLDVHLYCNKQMRITANTNREFIYIFTKDALGTDAMSSSDLAQHLAGMEGRASISFLTGGSVIDIPSNAKYMYFIHSNYGTNDPQSIKMGVV